MIRSFSAVTREIDDVDIAVAEILSGLDLANNQLTHSVAIISCFSEAIDTGAVKGICDALPFDTIGATTCMSATAQEVDQIMVSVMVLTSDDCDFRTVQIPVEEAYQDAIQEGIAPLLAHPMGRPSLILSYVPLINEISGDMIISAMDGATGGIPLFGTTTVDHTMDYSTSVTIHGGESYRRGLCLLALYGPVDFTFELAALNEERIRPQKAIITASQGNILMGVNGMTAKEYLKEIGMAKEFASGMGIVPFVVDHGDGTKPVARAAFALTPEGYAVCGGAMPVNATLSIALIDGDDVLSTTRRTMEAIVFEGDVVLAYSCISRFLALGVHSTAEAEAIGEIAGKSPYLFASSGGEVCPLPDGKGNLINIYHNYTSVFCRLR